MTNNSMGNRTLKKAALLGAALFLMIPCFSSQTNPDSGEQTDKTFKNQNRYKV